MKTQKNNININKRQLITYKQQQIGRQKTLTDFALLKQNNSRTQFHLSHTHWRTYGNN